MAVTMTTAAARREFFLDYLVVKDGEVIFRSSSYQQALAICVKSRKCFRGNHRVKMQCESGHRWVVDEHKITWDVM